MSEPFDPPEAEVPFESHAPVLSSPLQDPHVVVLGVLLLVYGLPMCGFSMLFPPVGVVGGLTDPEFSDIPGGFLIPACIGTLEGACIGGMATLFVAGGIGLFTGRKWGWGLALVACALWMGSPCCIPFGGYGLFALLRERVRRAYGL